MFVVKWKNMSANITEHTMEHGGKTYTFYCGKNAKGNDEILEDYFEPWDVWFHVEGLPSGHVILRNDNLRLKSIRGFPRQVLKRGACICKATTKTSGSVTIIYTFRNNVQKTEHLGEVTCTDLRKIVV